MIWLWLLIFWSLALQARYISGDVIWLGCSTQSDLGYLDKFSMRQF